MAHEITELTRSVAPSADYPWGDIADSGPSSQGTLANRKMFTDMLQFFQKLMDDAGITPNGDDDNDSNGYQLIEALQQYPLPIPAFTDVATFGTQWNSFIPIAQYTKDYSGRVYLRGAYTSTGATPSQLVATLPVDYRPLANKNHYVACVAFNATTASYYTAHIVVNNNGEISFLDASQVPTASNWLLFIDTMFIVGQ